MSWECTLFLIYEWFIASKTCTLIISCTCSNASVLEVLCSSAQEKKQNITNKTVDKQQYSKTHICVTIPALFDSLVGA